MSASVPPVVAFQTLIPFKRQPSDEALGLGHADGFGYFSKITGKLRTPADGDQLFRLKTTSRFE
jgi:hypothetical protein